MCRAGKIAERGVLGAAARVCWGKCSSKPVWQGMHPRLACERPATARNLVRLWLDGDLNMGRDVAIIRCSALDNNLVLRAVGCWNHGSG